jgi:hypothetical protein
MGDLKDVGCDDTDWIQQDQILQWQVLVDIVKKLWVR